MIKCLIIDFDGTLADTRALIVNTMQEVIAELGLPPRSDDECASMIGLPLKETFTGLIPMSEETGKKCVERYADIFTKRNVPGAVPAFEGVVGTLSELHRRGFVLTIASSRNRPSLISFLKEMDLLRYIFMVVSVVDVDRSKPAPDMVLKILDAVGCAPEEAIVVGDTKFDIEMGRRAGVRTCGVTYGNGTREELVAAGADCTIDGFAELSSLPVLDE